MDGQTLFKLSCIQDGRTLYCRKQLHPWFLQVNEIIFDLSPSNLGSFERLQRGACDWPFQNCRICLPSRNVLERPRGRSVVWQACMCCETPCLVFQVRFQWACEPSISFGAIRVLSTDAPAWTSFF